MNVLLKAYVRIVYTLANVDESDASTYVKTNMKTLALDSLITCELGEHQKECTDVIYNKHTKYEICWFRSLLFSWMCPIQSKCVIDCIPWTKSHDPDIGKFIESLYNNEKVSKPHVTKLIKLLLINLINNYPVIMKENNIHLNESYLLLLLRALHRYNNSIYPNPGFFPDVLLGWYANNMLANFKIFGDKVAYMDKLRKCDLDKFDVIVLKPSYFQALEPRIGKLELCSVALANYNIKLMNHITSVYLCDGQWHSTEYKLRPLSYQILDNGDLVLLEQFKEHNFKFNIHKGLRIATYMRNTSTTFTPVSIMENPVKEPRIIGDIRALIMFLEGECNLCEVDLLNANKPNSNCRISYKLTIDMDAEVQTLGFVAGEKHLFINCQRNLSDKTIVLTVKKNFVNFQEKQIDGTHYQSKLFDLMDQELLDAIDEFFKDTNRFQVVTMKPTMIDLQHWAEAKGCGVPANNVCQNEKAELQGFKSIETQHGTGKQLNNKLRILGRERKIYKDGRKCFIIYHKQHLSLTEARKLEKQMMKRKQAKAKNASTSKRKVSRG